MRECVDRFGGLIWSIARRAMPTRADAEELVKEIFADLWRTAGRFDPQQGSEEIFVTQVARRRLIDRMRRTVQREQTRSVDPLHWTDHGSGAVCPEATKASRAVMQLRPELRKVLELGLLQGLSHAEIAERLHIPLEAVKTRMTRGLIQVREFMG
jgi:RNA polymerase sigma-70 factor (ECF subfamily)